MYARMYACSHPCSKFSGVCIGWRPWRSSRGCNGLMGRGLRAVGSTFPVARMEWATIRGAAVDDCLARITACGKAWQVTHRCHLGVRKGPGTLRACNYESLFDWTYATSSSSSRIVTTSTLWRTRFKVGPARVAWAARVTVFSRDSVSVCRLSAVCPSFIRRRLAAPQAPPAAPVSICVHSVREGDGMVKFRDMSGPVCWRHLKSGRIIRS